MSAACQYATDVTDAQWELLYPLLPQPTWTLGSRGRPPRPLRRMVNGVVSANLLHGFGQFNLRNPK